jgi:predicted RNase H-like HicB family nuclease
MTQRRYLIVIEGDGDSFSSYAPDLPGCVATGGTRDEVEREMRAAIAFHLEGLQLAGQPIPEPSEFTAVDVEVAA